MCINMCIVMCYFEAIGKAIDLCLQNFMMNVNKIVSVYICSWVKKTALRFLNSCDVLFQRNVKSIGELSSLRNFGSVEMEEFPTLADNPLKRYDPTVSPSCWFLQSCYTFTPITTLQKEICFVLIQYTLNLHVPLEFLMQIITTVTRLLFPKK